MFVFALTDGSSSVIHRVSAVTGSIAISEPESVDSTKSGSSERDTCVHSCGKSMSMEN